MSSTFFCAIPTVFRHTPRLHQGANGGLGGAGVSMTPMTPRRVFGDDGQTSRTIQPSILEQSAALDQEALAQRRRSPVARALERLDGPSTPMRVKGGGGSGTQEGEGDEEEEKGNSAPPLLSRAWREVPRSLLSTHRTRQDWFRLMHFNMMVDRWNNYATAPATFSSQSTTTGSADGARLPIAHQEESQLDVAASFSRGGGGGSGGSFSPKSSLVSPTSLGMTKGVGSHGTSTLTTTPVVPAHIRVPPLLRRIPFSPSLSLPLSISSFPPTTSTTSNSSDTSESPPPLSTTVLSTPFSHTFGEFEAYDPTVHELPPYLTREHRRQHLLQLLKAYDPDVVTLNEVQREFFMEDIFKYVRYLGYGALFQSSRGARVRCLRRGQSCAPLSSMTVRKGALKGVGRSSSSFDPPPPARVQHARSGIGMTVESYEDIGNAILFHKGRFVPLLSGGDYGKHFHYAHFTNLRDCVTNLNLLVACVQLTAGNTPLARDIRTHEATQIKTLIDAFGRYDADRSHMSTVICGDFNNESLEEPCLEILRESFFSTYDLAGGPRWTTWHYTEPWRTEVAQSTGTPGGKGRDPMEEGYTTYFRQNVKEFLTSHAGSRAKSEIQQHVTYRQEAADMMRLIGAQQRDRAGGEKKPVKHTEDPTTTQGSTPRMGSVTTATPSPLCPSATGAPWRMKEKAEVGGLVQLAEVETLYPWTWMRGSTTAAAALTSTTTTASPPVEPASVSAAAAASSEGEKEAVRSESTTTGSTPSEHTTGTTTAMEETVSPEKQDTSAAKQDAMGSTEMGTEKRTEGTSVNTTATTALEKAPGNDSTWEETDGSGDESKRIRKKVMKRTQDFIFYDPNRIALHQLLDVPEDKELHPQQLLPCTALPSHHLPLVVDISFNQRFPDVGEMSLKE